MIVYPNAKINIGLNIIEKKLNGYHEISSVFYPVRELFDILEILPSDIFSFSSTGISIPGKSNTCTQAYDLFKQEFNITPVKIHLHKQIPVGGGLGGGSADGAFTLIVLNEIFDLKLSKTQLEKYALRLGADCPFFIQNTSKHVTGIGEKMQAYNLDLSAYHIKFIFPRLHISTTEAYSRVIPKLPKIDLLNIINQPLNTWKVKLRNDFEESIFSQYHTLKEMKEKLYADGAIYASMTGSGSVLYGIFQK